MKTLCNFASTVCFVWKSNPDGLQDSTTHVFVLPSKHNRKGSPLQPLIGICCTERRLTNVITYAKIQLLNTMNQLQKHEPQHVTVAELTPSELHAPSGIEDLTNLEAIRFIEGALHGAQNVYLNASGRRSGTVNAEVSRITREKSREEHPIAVVSVRPPLNR
jgi:hypothetical protein